MDSSPGYQAGILTISDKGARGDRKDTSGPQLVRQLSAAGFIVSETAIIPDHQATISDTICKWVDHHKIDLVAPGSAHPTLPRRQHLRLLNERYRE